MTARPSLASDEEGISLVELVIYVLVGFIVTGIITALVIVGLTAEADARSRDGATGEALVAQTSLQTSLRNALAGSTEVTRSEDGTTTTLAACVLQHDGAWKWMWWQVAPHPEEPEQQALSVRTDGGSAAIIAADITSIAEATPYFVVEATQDFDELWKQRGAKVVDYRFQVRQGDVRVPVDGRVLAQAWSDAGKDACSL